MNSTLKKGYQIIFGKEPEVHKQEWQVAEEIMNNFNVPKLGEDMAKEVLFEVILHVPYPDIEITHRIVGRAEGFAEELFEELVEHDAHMDAIEVLERKYREDKKRKQELKLESGAR